MVGFSSTRKRSEEEIPLYREIRDYGCHQWPGAMAFEGLVRRRAELFGLSPALPELSALVDGYVSTGRSSQPSVQLARIDPEEGVKRGPDRYITIYGEGQLLRPITLARYHLAHLLSGDEAVTRIAIDELGARLSVGDEEIMRVEACALIPAGGSCRTRRFELAGEFMYDLTGTELPFGDMMLAERNGSGPWVIRYSWTSVR